MARAALNWRNRASGSGLDSVRADRSRSDARILAYGAAPTPIAPTGASSEDREPAYRPGGNLIAFVTDGVDANGDGRIDGHNATGKFHIWLMNRDGSQQRQVTGLVTSGAAEDDDHDQFFPAWSPDGNQLVYCDVGVFRTNFDAQFTNGTLSKTELLVLTPNLHAASSQPQPVRITFSGGDKRRPTWSPSGQNIAFATNTNPKRNQSELPPTFPYDTLTVPNNPARAQFDIFTISNTGDESTIVRLTGGSVANGDPTDDVAGQYVDDLNPAYAHINQGVIFFSSMGISISIP